MKKILRTIVTTMTIILAVMVFNIVSVSAVSKPDAPATVNASTTTNSITISWSNASNADGYRVYYKTSEKASWKKAVNSTTETSHTFKKLPNGKIYYFAVRGYDKKNSKTVYGDYKEIKTATKPVATKKITSKQGTKSVELKWEKVNSATHYRIYQKVNGNWKALGYTTKLSYTVKKLTPGKKYTFAIKSYVKDDKLSVAGEYKTANVTIKPAAPVKINGIGTKDSILLKWDDVTGATSYRIYQKTTNGWKYLGSTNESSYTVKNLKANKSYTFAVKSCIKTSSGLLEGGYKEVTTKTDDECIGVTSGGLKLYPITSEEAKAIRDKWGVPIFEYVEAKNKNGTVLIYKKNSTTWTGTDIQGASYDPSGNIEYCPYCGKISGRGTNMCNGCANTFG